jgi:hypothetical protein
MPVADILLPFGLGIILTTGLLFVSSIVGLHKDRGVYPVTLIAIALFYVVFAFEHGGVREIVFNSVVACLFLLFAIGGYVRSLWIVAIGLIIHGLFDVVYSESASSPAPDWWAPFCLSVDLLLGLFLAVLIWKNKIHHTPTDR